jgi:hypothetical protein
MLENLFKTWQTLAPDEIKFKAGTPERYVHLIKGERSHSPVIEAASGLLTHEKYFLQGYIQQCIHSRGWYFCFQRSHDYCRAEVRTKVEEQSYQYGKNTDACHEILLTAYLIALAAQREIIPSSNWEHFKGGRVEVKRAAFSIIKNHLKRIKKELKDRELEDVVSHGRFCLEEEQSKSARLFNSQNNWFYFLEEDAPVTLRYQPMGFDDRVFYHHENVKYARLKSSFLGLVGPEHPEQEGLLRFTEVSGE